MQILWVAKSMWVWKWVKEKGGMSWSSQTSYRDRRNLRTPCEAGSGLTAQWETSAESGSEVRVRESSKRPLCMLSNEGWIAPCHEAGRAFRAKRTKCTQFVDGWRTHSKFREGNQQCWLPSWLETGDVKGRGRDRPRGSQGPGKCELKRKGHWPLAREWLLVTLSGQSHLQ